jgi:hypothetical protein
LAKKKILAKKHVFCHWHEMYPYVYRCKHIYIYVNVVWYRCLLTTRTPSKQVWGYWWHVAGKTAVSRCWTSSPPKNGSAKLLGGVLFCLPPVPDYKPPMTGNGFYL